MLAALLKLARFPMAFTAMADSAAGSMVGLGRIDAGVMLGLMGISACLYMCGMVVNDLADVRRDRDLHPERPLVTGAVSWGMGLMVALILAAAGLGLASLLGKPLGIAAILMGAILLYDLALKHLGVFGAMGMGACRGLNFLMGLSMADDLTFGLPFVGLTFLYVTIVTCISLLEESANRPLFVSLVLVLSILPLGILAVGPDTAGRWGAAIVTAAVLTQVAARTVGPVIGFTLRLLIVLNAAYVASFGHYLGAVLLLSLFPLAWGAARLLKVIS